MSLVIYTVVDSLLCAWFAEFISFAFSKCNYILALGRNHCSIFLLFVGYLKLVLHC